MISAKSLEVVKAMRALYDDETKWTQKEYARNAAGKEVPSTDDSAVCWCLQGAMNKIVCKDRNEFHQYYSEIYVEIADLFPGHSMMFFNDMAKTKYQTVIDMLDSIIAENTNAA